MEPFILGHSTKHLTPSFEASKIQELARKKGNNFYWKLNSLRIKQINLTLNHLTGHIINIKNTLRKTLEIEDFTNFTTRQTTSHNITLNKARKTKNQKLQHSKDNKFKPYYSDWLINNTDIILPRESKSLQSHCQYTGKI